MRRAEVERAALGGIRMRGEAPLVTCREPTTRTPASAPGQVDDRGRCSAAPRRVTTTCVPSRCQATDAAPYGVTWRAARVLERGERPRRDADAAVAGGVRCEARDGAVQPVGDRAERVVVERGHLAGVDRAVGQQAVPALPHGRRAHRHGVQPRRALGLQQQALGGVEVPAVGQGVGHERRADEARWRCGSRLRARARRGGPRARARARDRVTRSNSRASAYAVGASLIMRPAGVTYSRDERGAAALGEGRVVLGIAASNPSSTAASATMPQRAGEVGASRRCRRRPWPGRACRAARRGRASRRAACVPAHRPWCPAPARTASTQSRMLAYCALEHADVAEALVEHGRARRSRHPPTRRSARGCRRTAGPRARRAARRRRCAPARGRGRAATT